MIYGLFSGFIDEFIACVKCFDWLDLLILGGFSLWLIFNLSSYFYKK